jgi:hypothetical protein
VSLAVSSNFGFGQNPEHSSYRPHGGGLCRSALGRSEIRAGGTCLCAVASDVPRQYLSPPAGSVARRARTPLPPRSEPFNPAGIGVRLSQVGCRGVDCWRDCERQVLILHVGERCRCGDGVLTSAVPAANTVRAAQDSLLLSNQERSVGHSRIRCGTTALLCYRRQTMR